MTRISSNSSVSEKSKRIFSEVGGSAVSRDAVTFQGLAAGYKLRFFLSGG